LLPFRLKAACPSAWRRKPQSLYLSPLPPFGLKAACPSAWSSEAAKSLSFARRRKPQNRLSFRPKAERQEVILWLPLL